MPDPLTYAEYVVAIFGLRPREQRRGQWAFNVLSAQRPDLAEFVRASGLDPFYEDSRMNDFLDFVGENWDG